MSAPETSQTETLAEDTVTPVVEFPLAAPEPPIADTAVAEIVAAAPEVDAVPPQDIDTVAIRVTPPLEPMPPPLDDAPLVTAEQVRLTLLMLQKAHDALPLDDDLATPRQVEANYVRRSLLGQHQSRLRLAHQYVQELEPKRTLYRDWVATLQSCTHDHAAQLTALEESPTPGPRAATIANLLRQSLAIVANGPEWVGGGEYLTDILVKWFKDHGVGPLPGETGIFAGRGGLHAATARYEEAKHLLAVAEADLERALHAAQALL